jgi:phage FluMu protein Com
MEEIRCKCGKLLFKSKIKNLDIEIKCPRCKQIYRHNAQQSTFDIQDMRGGRTIVEKFVIG